MPSRSSSRLSQQQRLAQRLLPQQVRLARMLELTDREMEEEVKHQLEENPALEQSEANPAPELDGNAQPTASDPGERRYLNIRPQAPDGPDPGSLAVARAATLSEFLSEQLHEQNLPEKALRLAEYMTGSIDSNGWFTRTIPQLEADAAANFEPTFDFSTDDVRRAWSAIRALEPPGIGAMDLRDCLLLQLDRLPDRTPYVKEAREVVRHYFDIFSHRNFSLLAEESGLDIDSIREANRLILTLNPKPAAHITAESDANSTQSVVPDFIVDTDGETVTVSMPSNLPELEVEDSFNIADEAPDTEGNEFIRTCAREARSFIDLIRRRRQTLMIIASAIVRIQREFFLSGDDESRIRPMVLRDVASAAGMDISTVSRAVAGKWIATQFGVYSLKSFFNEQVADSSSREVLAALREIIENEDPSAPLGDDTLTAMLNERGYKLARRTVAKYRDRLGIAPSRMRRTI